MTRLPPDRAGTNSVSAPGDNAIPEVPGVSRSEANDVRHNARSIRDQYPVIRASDLTTPDARRSRAVSHEEFQEIAGRGEQRVREMSQRSADPRGLDHNWGN